jgi:predicted signal transduction protein with EAL and GGDEF domain
MFARVGASIGWARYPADGIDIDTLIKVSDTRMFDFKKARKAG